MKKFSLFFVLFVLSFNLFANSCKNFVSAAWIGDKDLIQKYIDSAYNIECTYEGMTPLFAAARYGKQPFHWDENIEIVKMLVANGSDINYTVVDRDGKKMTPTYIASLLHHINTALFLVDHGGSLSDLEQGYEDRLEKEYTSATSLELIGNAFSFIFGIPKDSEVSQDVQNGWQKFKNTYMEEMKTLSVKQKNLADKYWHQQNYKKANFWYNAAKRSDALSKKYTK